jgi:hypothetical protein
MSFAVEMLPPLSKRHAVHRFIGCGLLLCGISLAAAHSSDAAGGDGSARLVRIVLLVTVSCRRRSRARASVR